LSCNAQKADKLPNDSGRKAAGELRPLKPPRQPTTAELLRAGLEFLPRDVIEDFGSYLYWNAELQAYHPSAHAGDAPDLVLAYIRAQAKQRFRSPSSSIQFRLIPQQRHPIWQESDRQPRQ